MAKKVAKATRQTLLKVNRRGFTLIELSVVIVLIALFAAVIMPKLIVVKNSQEAAAFRTDITRFFREARESSITSRRVVEVRYTSGAWDMVRMPGEAEDAEEQSIKRLEMPDGAEATNFRLQNRDVSGDEFLVRCFPDGTTSDASLEWGNGEETYVLKVNGNSGNVTMARGSIEDEADPTWPAGEIEKRAG